MELSLWGKLVKLIWKIPEVTTTIVYSNGEVATGRVITDNLADNLSLVATPTAGQYYSNYTEGAQIPSIVSISFSGEGLQYYKDQISFVEWK